MYKVYNNGVPVATVHNATAHCVKDGILYLYTTLDDAKKNKPIAAFKDWSHFL